jgi:hypothetical protein
MDLPGNSRGGLPANKHDIRPTDRWRRSGCKQLSLKVKQPFSFAQTVAFLRHFLPCQGEYVVADRVITGAGRARRAAAAAA